MTQYLPLPVFRQMVPAAGREASVLAALIVILGVSGLARAEESVGWSGTAAIGPISFPKYVGGRSVQTLPIPLLSINYQETFYIELERVGVYLLASDDKKVGLGLAMEPRFGFSSKDGPRLVGMGKRRDSLEAGPTFDWDFDVVAVSLAYFADASGASRGRSLRASAYAPAFKNERWDTGVLLNIDAMSQKTADYYFGVRAAEATVQRSPFAPTGATNLSAGVTGTYKLDKQYALMFGAIVTRLPGHIAASPIVESRQARTLYFGFGWTL
jgi:outer membrane protein